MAIRVHLADDHTMFREGLESILASRGGGISGRAKKRSAPLPIFSAVPESLWEATEAPNPSSRPPWPTL